MRRVWQWLTRAAHRVRQAAAQVARRVSDWVRDLRHRHADRARRDTRYVATLADGLVAAVTTVIVHPMLTLIVTAVITALLTTPASESPRRPDPWANEDQDYGPIGDYDAEAAWSSPPRPRPAWDVYRG